MQPPGTHHAPSKTPGSSLSHGELGATSTQPREQKEPPHPHHPPCAAGGKRREQIEPCRQERGQSVTASPPWKLCSSQQLGMRRARESAAGLGAPGRGEAKPCSREQTQTSVAEAPHPCGDAQSCTAFQERGDRHSSDDCGGAGIGRQAQIHQSNGCTMLPSAPLCKCHSGITALGVTACPAQPQLQSSKKTSTWGQTQIWERIKRQITP